MKTEVTRTIRADLDGRIWVVDVRSTTYYPDGSIDKIILENKWGEKTFVRYNQIGEPICGNLALA